MTAILNASTLIQLAVMMALLGLAATPILVFRIIHFSRVRQRVTAHRQQARTRADIAAASEIDEWFRRH